MSRFKALFLEVVRKPIEHVRSLARHEQWALALVAVLHGAALTWGLPSSDGWDNDGVAPRDFLPGLVQTFTPGDHYTYPPLHLLTLAVLTLPVTLTAALRAKSFATPDLVASFLDVRVMTSFSVVARLLAFAYAIGIVLAVGELAAVLAGPARKNARAFGILVAGCDVTLTYYGQTTNLDVPYLFWGVLAITLAVKALAEDRARGLRGAAVCAALAVATKDQAYALFLLSLPVVVAVWLSARRHDVARARELVREAAIASALCVGIVLLVDGALFNPTGFAARVRFLLGPASQDFAQYSKDATGRWEAFADSMWRQFDQHYPLFFAPLVVAGIAVAFTRAKDARARATSALPLLAAASFALAFCAWARRVEERFVMPQMIFAAVYVAITFDAAVGWARARAARIAMAVTCAAALAVGLRKAASVDAIMWGDPKYRAEEYLEAHATPDDAIEVYGRNVYIPRFRPWMKVTRIGTDPAEGRNPMPGIVDKRDRFGAIDERRPRFVVFGQGFVWRYRATESDGPAGRVQPPVVRAGLADHDGRDYFRRLFAGQAGYREVMHAKYESRLFPGIEMHGSLGQEIWVFERTP